MKSRLYFGIGLLLILIALGNSLLSMENVNQYLLKYWQTKEALVSNSPSPAHSTQNVEQSQVSSNSNIDLNREFSAQTPAIIVTETEQGFLPVQIEKKLERRELENKSQQIDPMRLIIKSIELDAPIQPAEKKELTISGKTYNQWSAPDLFAVGWQFDSVGLGVKGNTVLNGHHNVFGKVFENLDKLETGDRIQIDGSDGSSFYYIVTNVMILPERDVDFEQRLDNARWIMPSSDERITLITCWPYYSNTHRLIIVAMPVIEMNTELIQ